MNVSIVTKELKDIRLKATDVAVIPAIKVNLWNAEFDDTRHKNDYDAFREFCEKASYSRGRTPSLSNEYYLSIPYQQIDSMYMFDTHK